jgi:hypothetical protein
VRDMLACRDRCGSVFRGIDEDFTLSAKDRIMCLLGDFDGPNMCLERVVFIIGSDVGIKDGRPWHRVPNARLERMIADGKDVIEWDIEWYHEITIISFLSDLVDSVKQKGLFPEVKEWIFAEMSPALLANGNSDDVGAYPAPAELEKTSICLRGGKVEH